MNNEDLKPCEMPEEIWIETCHISAEPTVSILDDKPAVKYIRADLARPAVTPDVEGHCIGKLIKLLVDTVEYYAEQPLEEEFNNLSEVKAIRALQEQGHLSPKPSNKEALEALDRLAQSYKILLTNTELCEPKNMDGTKTFPPWLRDCRTDLEKIETIRRALEGEG